MALSARHETFCQEFQRDANASEAMRRAGFAASYCRQPHRLLAREDIQRRLAELAEARAQRTQIDADRVLRELGYVGFSDVADLFERIVDPDPDAGIPLGGFRLRHPCEIPEATRRAVAGFKVRRTRPKGSDDPFEEDVVEVKLWDKPGALKTIAEHLGMLVKRHEHSGPGGGPIPVTELPLTDRERAARLECLLAAARDRSAGE